MVEGRIDPNAEQLRLEYPYTTEVALNDPDYAAGIERFYDECAGRLAARLETGKNVALLCEGDPFFYGSSMYLFDRLRGAYRSEVVAGVAGMSGCWAAAGLPIVHGDDVLAILPGTLDEPFLTARLQACDAAVIMKVGRNLAKIRTALRHVGMIERRHLRRTRHHAWRAHHAALRFPRGAGAVFLDGAGPGPAARAMTSLHVVELGPGAAELQTPQAGAALAQATDLVGYAAYLARVPERLGQRRHASSKTLLS